MGQQSPLPQPQGEGDEDPEWSAPLKFSREAQNLCVPRQSLRSEMLETNWNILSALDGPRKMCQQASPCPGVTEVHSLAGGPWHIGSTARASGPGCPLSRQ